MRTINRIGIAVTPRKPYMAWAKSIDDGAASLEIVANEFTSIYLVEAPDAFKPEQVIRKHYAAIFEEQLNSWHRDEAQWPSRRTEAMFREWFDAKVVEMVWDLGRGRIIAEE
jgi:hypothetical protein